MLKQKFRRGNLVHIKKGACQFNFKQGCNAIILGSYDDFFGGGDIFQYSVMFEDGEPCSWYRDRQLTFVEHGGEQQIHKFIDSCIMHEASKNPVFDMPEFTEEQLEKIEVPENIEVPYHPICRCEIDTIPIREHIEPGNWVAVNQNGEAVKGSKPNKLKNQFNK